MRQSHSQRTVGGMKRVLLAAALACLSFSAQARPSSSPSVTQYDGDRISARQSAPVVRQTAHAEGMMRAPWRATHGRPRAWCGWWLGQHLGMPLRSLWLARNWASVGSPAGGPAPGVVVVWRHHVGLITGRQAGQWIVKSGNDGHRVRERPRSVARAIAFRRV